MQQGTIDPRHLVLALIGFSSDGEIQGRTLLQKTAYFVRVKMPLDVPFEAHYYGPYSEVVAKATESLVALGFVKETSEQFPSVHGFLAEVHRYTYSLTDDGKKVLRAISKSEVFTRIIETIEAINRTSFAKDYFSLSIAAKTFFILQREKRLMTAEGIAEIAASLNWQLKESEIDRASQFLVELGLVTQRSNKAINK